MKPIKEFVVPLGVGAIAALLADFALSPLWLHLGWRRPVADWMVAIGLPTTVAAYWAMVWINLPSWVVALGAGVAAGMMRRKTRWLRFTLLSCVGFILTPHIILLLTFGFHPWSSFGPSVAVQTFLWNAVAIPLLLLGAWLAVRGRHSLTSDRTEESRGLST